MMICFIIYFSKVFFFFLRRMLFFTSSASLSYSCTHSFPPFFLLSLHRSPSRIAIRETKKGNFFLKRLYLDYLTSIAEASYGISISAQWISSPITYTGIKSGRDLLSTSVNRRNKRCHFILAVSYPSITFRARS